MDVCMFLTMAGMISTYTLAVSLHDNEVDNIVNMTSIGEIDFNRRIIGFFAATYIMGAVFLVVFILNRTVNRLF